MPNWCYTQINFHGNKTEIEDFNKKIKEWTSTCGLENGFGHNWLGNILHHVGLGDCIDNSDANVRIRCRGSVEYVSEVECEDDDAMFHIEVESAWSPMIKMWIETIKALEYESVDFSYIAEEPGNELYEIYDPYGDFGDRYYIDMYLEGKDELNEDLRKLDDERYYDSEKSIISALQQVLKSDAPDLEFLIEKIENYPFKDENSYIHVHAFNILESLEYCDYQ